MRFANTLVVLASLVCLASTSVVPRLHEHDSYDDPVGSQKRQSNTTWLEDYDYVVVGSGPGGGPVAARLAIAGFKVLLIDAGDDEGSSYQEQVPALQLQSTEYGPMKWDYFVNYYQDEARQEKDSKMTWETPSGELFVGTSAPAGSKPLGILYPRSGTLGGCSAHNALITIYPFESDWNNIMNLTGDSSWAAANMRTYFEKLERNGYLPSSIVGHGYSGWLGTSLTSLALVIEDQKLLSLIVSAATAMGQSLYRADLMSTSASPTGSGSVNAKREVIISAGSFNTPQLLKLSGIGPAEELQQFNIPVVVDPPGVGTNLQDRYETTVAGKTETDFVITEKCTFLRTLPDPCLTQWINGIDQTTKGTYATNGIAIAVVKKSSVVDGDLDLLISGAPAYFKGYYPGYSDIALADAHHWAWITLKAHSRNNAGTVTLRSTDPRDTPVINFNSFDTGVTADGADEKDLQAVYEAMEYSRQAYKDLIPLDDSFTDVWLGPNVTTEAELKTFIKDEAWGHHASCTCPIGADDDPMAVLDSNFRVRGVQGLRVVDASVFPKIPGFYIALPIYMVSEKAADVIIQGVA